MSDEPKLFIWRNDKRAYICRRIDDHTCEVVGLLYGELPSSYGSLPFTFWLQRNDPLFANYVLFDGDND